MKMNPESIPSKHPQPPHETQLPDQLPCNPLHFKWSNSAGDTHKLK